MERTLADLVELGTDLSLVADAARGAARPDKLTALTALVSYLSPIAAHRESDGRTLAGELFGLAGIDLVGWGGSGRATIDPMATPLAQSRDRLVGPTGQVVAAHRHEIADVLARHGVTNARIFGSVTRGDDHEGSDLDLLVDFAPDTSLPDIIDIQMELEDFLGVSVDLVPAKGLRERVRASAEQDLVAL